MSKYIKKEDAINLYKKHQPYMATRSWEFEQELLNLPTVSFPEIKNRMTNEEAQIVIGNIPICGDECYSIAEYQEAKTMAIKALSVPEREKGTLEKIRAEIADLQGKDYYVGFNICKNRVLEIIDKYIGG